MSRRISTEAGSSEFGRSVCSVRSAWRFKVHVDLLGGQGERQYCRLSDMRSHIRRIGQNSLLIQKGTSRGLRERGNSWRRSHGFESEEAPLLEGA